MDDKVMEKLAQSLTSDETGIIPFLPYILQDFWELGSSPTDMLALFKEHIAIDKDMRVLDLACGKGAVSVQLAKELGIRFKGVDLLPEFIDFAIEKAGEYGVSELCEFAVQDVNASVARERGYDCCIFGAVGDILGDYRETVSKLRETVRPGGYIIIDDAYVEDDEANSRLQFDKPYPTYGQWLQCFEKSGLSLIECRPNPETTPESVEKDMIRITRRANELMERYPARRQMFEQYIINQQNEYSDLENALIGATWLVRRI